MILKIQEIQGDFLGTKIIIKAFSNKNLEKLFLECFKFIENFENKYSRFKKGNFLDKINNSNDWIDIDKDFFKMLSFSLELAKKTNGIFDPTVISILEKKGYGGFDKIDNSNNFGYKNILLEKNRIKLLNGVKVELGAVGKGYLIDKISELFSGIDKVLINFGGDIYAKGEWKIALENPQNPALAIGTIFLKDSFFACSSTEKRKFGKFNHIINMKNKESATEIIATFVESSSGIKSDGYATLLNILGKNEVIYFIEKEELKALIIFKDFSYFLSENFKVNFFD